MVMVMVMSMCAMPCVDGAMVGAQGGAIHVRDFRIGRRT